MSEPRTKAGKALLQSLAEMAEHQAAGLPFIKPPTRFVATGRDAILRVEAEAGSLDAAWAEAEAVLPEGWHLSVDTGSGKPRAHACPARFGADPQVNADCPTPAAALLALAARLRENR